MNVGNLVITLILNGEPTHQRANKAVDTTQVLHIKRENVSFVMTTRRSYIINAAVVQAGPNDVG